MRKVFAILFACVLLCSCSHSARVIPRGKMVKIYAEMALTDEYLSNRRELRRIADTSRVYASIFEKYGYTEEDFLASQEKYINDASRYSKMIKKAALLLEDRRSVLKDRRKALDDLELKAMGVMRYAPHFIYLLDSLDLADSTLLDFDFQQGFDTAYSGPRLIVWADTLIKESPDSLATADSLAAAKVVEEPQVLPVQPLPAEASRNRNVRESKPESVVKPQSAIKPQSAMKPESVMKPAKTLEEVRSQKKKK